MVNIFELIKQERAGCGSHTAVIEGELSVGYDRLLASAEKVAETLRKNGVSRLHRVGLLAEDSVDYIIASLAILSISAVVVPVSHDQSADEIEAVIERIDLDFILAEPAYLRGREAVPLSEAGFIKREFSLVSRGAKSAPPTGYDMMNPAFIRFSSGTTGASKGVLLSHESIVERTDAADSGMRITPEDRVLWVLSMSYHFVVTILLFLRRGATIVICSHRFPDALVEGILVHKGSFIYASPFHYSLLCRSSLLPPDSMSQVRLAVSTAIRLPDKVASDFKERFGFDLCEAYGIIEVGLPFMNLAGKRGSVGAALPDYRIMIDNQAADGTGEILVQGKGMLDAYFSPWQTRSDILRDGWFRTGDLGRVDSDGCLYIMGREKDVINFAGMKIFAQEVEEALNLHPAVMESLVFGTAHPQYGELPAAKVRLRDGEVAEAVLKELPRFCYQRLASYKVPKEFIVVDSIPRTASGKIRRAVSESNANN